MAFFAHAYYSWGGVLEAEEFYQHVLKTVFGELSEDIYEVMRKMLTIHESQINIFELEFPFARNKVELRDIPLINHAIGVYPVLKKKLEYIINRISDDSHLKVFRLHFIKWLVSLQRAESFMILLWHHLNMHKRIVMWKNENGSSKWMN